MNFSCERALLQTAVQTALRAVPPKNPNPALEGILVEVGGILVFTGYNLETGIRVESEAEITERGSLIFPAKLLGDIVRKLPDETVFVESDGLKVEISSGMSSYKLMAMAPEEFPALPEVTGRKSLRLPQNLLGEMLRATLFAVSEDFSRPIHTGARFEVEKDRLTLIAVDGFRLSIRRETLAEDSGSYAFVVPKTALSEIEKICGDAEEEAQIFLDEKYIQFQLGNTVVVSRRLEGDFLDWRRAIPQDSPISLVVETRRLLLGVERVSLMINERIKSPMRLIFGPNELHMFSNTALGDAYDLCPITGEGNGLEIGFNSRFFYEALRAIPDEEVRLGLSDNVSPCVILPREEDSDRFLYLILPVRLSSS